jgi:hypothetical protein
LGGSPSFVFAISEFSLDLAEKFHLEYKMTRLFCFSYISIFLYVDGIAVEKFENAYFPAFRRAREDYNARVPQDDFSKVREALASGQIQLDNSSEKSFVASLLQSLNISPSSQMLVFSTTSLQLSRISPQNPRAVYFNENVYVGWVPGGQIEVIGIDPEWGAMTYIFDIPKRLNEKPLIKREEKVCMRCHSSSEIGSSPGLLVSSVVPGPGGGSLDEFPDGEIGHHVPYQDRFGGWIITGDKGFGKHWGNMTGTLANGEIVPIPNRFGDHFPSDRYLVASSDLLAHILHEHQAGFVNTFMAATYRTRDVLDGKVPEIQLAERNQYLEWEAQKLVRYLLFADEAKLPAGISGDVQLKTHFLGQAKKSRAGKSLRDLNLQDRLFQHRCSYMIYSAAFSGLPKLLKTKVYERLRYSLVSDPDYHYLPLDERKAIYYILKETLTDLPSGW